MTEEPKPFSEFFSEGIARMKKAMSFNQAKMEVPIQKKMEELRKAVAKGHRARSFVASPFWTEDLLPFFQREAGGVKVWRPGQPFDPFDVKSNYFFSSGKTALLETLISRLTKWSEEGARAEKMIEFENSRLEENRRMLTQR